MTATPRLRLRRLAKSFGATPVLAGVDLDIAPGEFCVFVGPSGCGKSTLLRLVAGLDEPTAGDIDIDARTVTGLPPSQRDVAMVFQGYALYPHMSAFDNMAFGLAHRLPKSEIAQRVHEAARLLQLGDLLQRRPRELSGGQRQRVAIGRAIVRRPKVFLFDEPLSNLDAALRASTRVELARLHRGQGDASMVYVTHDQVEAMTLADRIVLLRPLGAGHSTSVAQVGPPLSLYHRPADRFVAGFIGSPGMNFMAALALEAGPGGLVASVGDQRWSTHADAGAVPRGTPLTLGVRPEHVRVGAGAARARVVHVERLGEHSVVHLQAPGTGNATLLAKSTRDDVAVDDVLSYDLPPSALHVFGPDGRAVQRLGESA